MTTAASQTLLNRRAGPREKCRGGPAIAARAAVIPCRAPDYQIKGTIPSFPIGIDVTGMTCRLDREFTATTDGDYVGRLVFTPSGKEAGAVTLKGKVGNAPLKVTGSGDYTVALSADGTSGTIDFPFTSTIEIPVVDNQTGTSRASLTLTQMPPCDKVPGR